MLAKCYPHPLGLGYLIVSQELCKSGAKINWPTPEQLKEAMLGKRRLESRGSK